MTRQELARHGKHLSDRAPVPETEPKQVTVSVNVYSCSPGTLPAGMTLESVFRCSYLAPLPAGMELVSVVISQQPHVPEASIDMAAMAPPALATRATRATSLELGCLLRSPSSRKVQPKPASQAGKGPRLHLQKAFSLDTGLAVHPTGPDDLHPGGTGKAHPAAAAHAAGDGSDRWARLSACGAASSQMRRVPLLPVGNAAHLHSRLTHKSHTAIAGCASSGFPEFMLPAYMASVRDNSIAPLTADHSATQMA